MLIEYCVTLFVIANKRFCSYTFFHSKKDNVIFVICSESFETPKETTSQTNKEREKERLPEGVSVRQMGKYI